jgi:hypothetical protein
MDTTQNSSDHDLLIEVSANVKNMSSNLITYNQNNGTMFTDHESRLRVVEGKVESITSEQHTQQRSLRTMLTVIGTILGVVSVVLTIIGFVVANLHN